MSKQLAQRVGERLLARVSPSRPLTAGGWGRPSGPGPRARRGTSARSGARPRRRSRRRRRARSRSGGGRRRSAARRGSSAAWTAAIACGVGDAPEPVDGAVVVGLLAARASAATCGASARPGGAGRVVVEREDRGEVRLRRARQPQAVLLGAGVRALVRADAARAVVLDAHAREEAVAGARRAVGPGVVLGERPERGLVVADDGARLAASASKLLARRRRTGRRPARRLGQVDRARRCTASARPARRAARGRSRRTAARTTASSEPTAARS